MPEVLGPDKLLSVLPQKRFGRPCLYGTAQYGTGAYGDQDIYYQRICYGVGTYGVLEYGDLILLSGIYKRMHEPSAGGLLPSGPMRRSVIVREDFYVTKNPRTIPQQSNRSKFADAVASWQGLTNEQKEVYNLKNKGRNYSGYNAYLKEYLLSH